jgi:hypothetical protein
MSVSQADVRKIQELVASGLGPPKGWTKWDGGWPGDIESALVDAVFSARAVYSTKNNRGVLSLVETWRGERLRTSFDLTALASEIAGEGPIAWAKHFRSSQHSPGRPATAPGGPTKAATVLEAAKALSATGVSSAADITDATVGNVKREMMRIPGIGFATTNYFLMLLGRPGVKPDTMIHRFLATACGHKFSNRDAEEAVTTVASELGVPAHLLDHAVWSYERDPARR